MFWLNRTLESKYQCASFKTKQIDAYCVFVALRLIRYRMKTVNKWNQCPKLVKISVTWKKKNNRLQWTSVEHKIARWEYCYVTACIFTYIYLQFTWNHRQNAQLRFNEALPQSANQHHIKFQTKRNYVCISQTHSETEMERGKKRATAIA